MNKIGETKSLVLRWAGWIAAAAVVTCWGTTFVASKVLLLSGLRPADIFFYRFLMAYLCLLTISHRKLFADSWHDELLFLGLGLTGGSVYFLSENMALIYSTTSNVSILVSSCPLLTALVVGFFYRDERLHGLQILGTILAFIGMAMIVLNGQLILHLNPLGDTLALVASLTWALYSLLMRMQVGKYSTDFITRKIFFYGLITILPCFLLVHPLQFDARLLESKILCNLFFLGLIASTGGYLLWNWVLRVVGTVKATNLIYFQTLVTMLVAHFVLGERITWMAIAGTFILILGMVWALKKR